ncbi:V-type ATP synthase subunit D [bacterium]|nr:V-type ATP synthase subunit D [bacterium]
MKAQVNATRMALLSHKKKIKIAKRGHKLLKDKLEELIRKFILLVKEYKAKRGDIEKDLKKAYNLMFFAKINMTRLDFNEFVFTSNLSVELKIEKEKIMNIEVPKLDVEFIGNPYAYSQPQSNVYLDKGVTKYMDVTKQMIELSSLEKSIFLLANEIETTRRRVNALEYILIPQFEETIKFISMKLDERARSALTQIMKIKDMLTEKRKNNDTT